MLRKPTRDELSAAWDRANADLARAAQLPEGPEREAVEGPALTALDAIEYELGMMDREEAGK